MTIKIHPHLQNFVRPSDHSAFSPSSADRWWYDACPASLKLSEKIPEEQSVYSIEGTLAHSICEAYVRQELYDIKFPEELSIKMLGYDYDELMECARGYYDVIKFWLNNKEVIGEIIWWGLEKGIPIFPEQGCFGTADCIIVGTKSSVVIDYKHGKGKNVSATSLQLKVYAAGVARFLIDVPVGYNIHAVVYQPRTDQHPKETFYTMPQLNQCLADIWKSIEASKSMLIPKEGNHCFWCPASRTKDLNLKCSIMKEKPLKLAQENFGKFMQDMNAPIDSLTAPNPKRDEAIIKLMSLYPMIKKVVEDANDEFMMRLQGGENIAGVRLIDEVGNRKLNAENDEAAIALLKTKFPNLNPVKIIPETKKLRTLTEIEKEIGKNKLDSLCVRKVTKKVDIIDDKIRAILGELAAYGEMINNGTTQE